MSKVVLFNDNNKIISIIDNVISFKQEMQDGLINYDIKSNSGVSQFRGSSFEIAFFDDEIETYEYQNIEEIIDYALDTNIFLKEETSKDEIINTLLEEVENLKDEIAIIKGSADS